MYPAILLDQDAATWFQYVRVSASDVGVRTAPAVGDGSPECAQDTDGDGFRDGLDNCPFAPNDQTDDGGVGTQSPDGVGNACQCGDLDGDGVVDASDVSWLRTCLAFPEALTSDGKAECARFATLGLCDVLEMVFLQRGLAGLDPEILQSCQAAQTPPP